MEQANAMSEENITNSELGMRPKQAEGNVLNVEARKLQVA